MKLATVVVTLALACAASAQNAPAPAKPALDTKALEEYLRNVSLFPPVVQLAIDPPAPSQYLPGFFELTLHWTFNNQTKDEMYYVTPDGKRLIKGDVYELGKSPFQANLDKLKTDLQPSFGEAGAPVVIVVFGDFQCPYCKTEAEAMRKLIPESYKGKVRVYFKDFPLEAIHPWARPASVAGRCVFRQDPLAFWKYHDWVYSIQNEIAVDNLNAKLMEWAGKSGLDTLQLGRCVDNKATDKEVAANMAEGRSLGVDSTPTLFINGRKLGGTLTDQALRQLIDFELEHQAKVADAGEKCCTITLPALGR
jgi:protein-disulfide isomerase